MRGTHSGRSSFLISKELKGWGCKFTLRQFFTQIFKRPSSFCLFNSCRLMTLAALDDYLSCHGLRVQSTSTKGRSVFANRSHKRGNVLITSQPLGTVVLPSSRHEICNYCFQKPQPLCTLQQCSQCKSAYFCDLACFKNAWLTYHQYVCQPPAATSTDHHQKSHDEPDALGLEMLERVALNCWRYNKRLGNTRSGTLAKGEEGVHVTMEAFYSLMGLQDDDGQRRQRQQALAQRALSRSYLANSGLTMDQLADYVGKFQNNNFDIHDDHLYKVGRGNYPVASLFNHSCRPNAVVLFDGSLLSVMAIEPIATGQEITIAYVDPAHDRQHRQSLLMKKYAFTCQCVRCVDATIYGHIDGLLGNEAVDQDNALALLRHATPLTGSPSSSSSSSSSATREVILQQVNDWDLLEMCRKYDRRHDGAPDPTEPLTLASYTHFAIQFFAPYLWLACNPAISFSSAHNRRTASPGALPSPPSRALSYFDDPLPGSAQPIVPVTYDAILNHVMTSVQTYPTSDIIPWRLDTLTTAAELLYDAMKQGQWRNAVKLGMYVLIQYCWIYPPYHPILAQHLLLLAKCSWNSIIKSELLGDGKAPLEMAYERGVRRWIMLSKETLAHAVGKNSEQWREVVELEWIFLREQKLKE